MNTNSRFAVAIHVLTLLALRSDEIVTSDYIACSVTTNAVVIRRVLGQLRRAGLVRSYSGNRGGWRLQRAPEQITLEDAYLAVHTRPMFALHPQQPNPSCCVGSTIQSALLGFFAAGEAAIQRHFGGVTVADVLSCVQTVRSVSTDPSDEASLLP